MEGGERGETRAGQPRGRPLARQKHHPAAVGTRAADGDGASESFGGEGGQIGAGGRLPVARANTPQTATAPRTNRPGLRVLNSS